MSYKNVKIFFSLVILFSFYGAFKYHEYANTYFVESDKPSGFILYIVIIYLACFNLRKKLTFIPLLGKAHYWTKFHILVGWLSISLFLVHIDFSYPTGILEKIVALIYSLTALSGIIGLFLTKYIPKKLTDQGGSIILETIPERMNELRKEAEEIILNSVSEVNHSTIAEFYYYRLASFFISPKNFSNHLLNSDRHMRKIKEHLKSVRRYLNEKELEIISILEEKVIYKDILDKHYYLQLVMKYWLFIHIPLTYSILIVGFIHGVVAYSF